MGEIWTPPKIYGMGGKAVELEALVNTGLTFTKISGTAVRELELEAKYETEIEPADGRRVKRGLALAEVELDRRGEETDPYRHWRGEGEAPYRLYYPRDPGIQGKSDYRQA